jgi:hypothetical protein
MFHERTQKAGIISTNKHTIIPCQNGAIIANAALRKCHGTFSQHQSLDEHGKLGCFINMGTNMVYWSSHVIKGDAPLIKCCGAISQKNIFSRVIRQAQKSQDVYISKNCRKMSSELMPL